MKGPFKLQTSLFKLHPSNFPLLTSLFTLHSSNFTLQTPLLALFLLVTEAPAQPNSSGQLQDVSIQLKWHHHFQFAGYYAALEQGFYSEEGLNVSLIAGGPDVPVAKVAVARS